MNLISEQKGYTIHLDNRMWFPTVSDIRNCCASTGLEVDRLEDLVEKFRSSGDSVEYLYEPDMVNFLVHLGMFYHEIARRCSSI